MREIIGRFVMIYLLLFALDRLLMEFRSVLAAKYNVNTNGIFFIQEYRLIAALLN